MFIVFSKNLFFFILISIASIMASVIREAKPDKICGETRSVLCVNNTLMSIATTTKIIERLANDIEKHILNKRYGRSTVNESVKLEMDSIRAHLPESKYHKNFFLLNNIDKEFLGHLLKEGHYAMSYYYNSIVDMIKTNDVYGFTTDSELTEIRDYLSNDIICQYRSILDVYSYEWPSINQIEQIEFSRRKHRNGLSLVSDAHSVIITRLLREWMQRIHSVIINVEAKFF